METIWRWKALSRWCCTGSPYCWSRMRGSGLRGHARWWMRWWQAIGVAYAITTGVGHLADVRISADQARELQINLVRSHAVGVGEPLSEAESRAMMLLRANSLAKG